MITRSQIEFNQYLRLEIAGVLCCPPLWKGQAHQHAFCELLYVVSGECTVLVKGQQYDLKEDSAIFIKPLENHTFETKTPNTILAYVGFQCETGSQLWLEKEIALDPLFFCQLPDRARLSNVLKQIVSESVAQGEELIRKNEMALLEGLMPIAKWINSLLKESMQKDPNQKNTLCIKTIKYIHLNNHRFVTVDEIAASLYIAPHYLGRLFASQMGITILRYQQTYKMEQAYALIKTGTLGMSEIADRLGFSSPQYFSRCYKSFYGVSPRNSIND